MARTQKNKATSYHIGLLKAKMAKLRRELITPKGGGGVAGEGFDVAKTGGRLEIIYLNSKIYIYRILSCRCSDWLRW
jgi:ribosome-interacting GTPase 1